MTTILQANKFYSILPVNDGKTPVVGPFDTLDHALEADKQNPVMSGREIMFFFRNIEISK